MTINTQDYQLSGPGSITFKPQAETKDANTISVFDSVFNAAMDIFNETNEFQLNANALQLDFAAGRTEDVLSVLLAQERAFSSLNFTVQVTNKIIESYREIMRMQL